MFRGGVMKRKRLTEIFPFLIPIRLAQRNFFYRIGLFLDKNTYAKTYEEQLPYLVASSKTNMINQKSGYDIIYQKNKVVNLQIASQDMNKIVLNPKETFSFYKLLKKNNHKKKYKEGLVLINGKIVAQKGGGICQLSNLIYYVALMTPLTIIERHGHKVKSLPNPDPDSLEGVDATISSGWLDLKILNDTKDKYQIIIDFQDEYMTVSIYSDKKPEIYYEIINENFTYFRKNNKIYESVDVIKVSHDIETKKVLKSQKLYQEVVEITYPLENNIKLEERE